MLIDIDENKIPENRRENKNISDNFDVSVKDLIILSEPVYRKRLNCRKI